MAKSKIPVNKTCKHKKISTRGCTEPTRDQYRQNTEDTLQDPLTGFFTKEKNPEKARGLQVPTTEKTHFQFFNPPAFCTKKQEARGLHSVIKLHSLSVAPEPLVFWYKKLEGQKN